VKAQLHERCSSELAARPAVREEIASEAMARLGEHGGKNSGRWGHQTALIQAASADSKGTAKEANG